MTGNRRLINPNGSDCMPGNCEIACHIDNKKGNEIDLLRKQLQQSQENEKVLRDALNCAIKSDSGGISNLTPYVCKFLKQALEQVKIND